MTDPRARPTATALLAALLDARSVELQLLDDLTDAQMLGTRDHFLEPPIWEMGHVGWFQEHWLLGHLDGRASSPPATPPLHPPLPLPSPPRPPPPEPSPRRPLAPPSAPPDAT